MTSPMKSGSMPFLSLGGGQSEAMATMQKELLDACGSRPIAHGSPA